MPELVDVEGWKRYLNRFAAGRRVESVAAPTPDHLRNTTPTAFGRALKGQRLERARRHGKWLLAPVTGGSTVVFHFGMTGSLTWTSRPDGLHEHDRVVFELDGGRLTHRSQRRFGGVWSARDEAEIRDITGDPGPDASELDRERFGELLAGRRGGVKSALMDQGLLAGIGNELSDEILWRARIHPRAAVGELGEADLDGLHAAMDEVIRAASRRGRIPDDEDGWLEALRGTGEPSCPRCGAEVETVTAAGRTAYVCSREQVLDPAGSG